MTDLSKLKVGDKVYSVDFAGYAEVTQVLDHEFHIEVVSGENSGDKAAYPFATTDASAFDLAS